MTNEKLEVWSDRNPLTWWTSLFIKHFKRTHKMKEVIILELIETRLRVPEEAEGERRREYAFLDQKAGMGNPVVVERRYIETFKDVQYEIKVEKKE